MSTRKLSMDELNRKSTEEFKNASKVPVVLVLDNVRSMNNIGSVFRTADAFLLQGIYLCGVTATPPHREIQKTALGATESVSWKHFPTTLDAVNDLKKDGFTVYAVEQVENSTMLDKLSLPHGKIALVFGNEVNGVEQSVIDACKCCIEIPQYGTKHSINLAVSVGIVVWEIAKHSAPSGSPNRGE
jgi:23S rRNA (guanosine2251-2'-O)-methyltransferase